MNTATFTVCASPGNGQYIADKIKAEGQGQVFLTDDEFLGNKALRLHEFEVSVTVKPKTTPQGGSRE